MITVVPYESSYRGLWDDYVTKAKNGLFLFQRGYLEYHSEKYPDNSLLFLEGDGHLIAVVPGTSSAEIWSSHDGLTFGGIICDATMKVERMLDVFQALVAYLTRNGIERFTYKPIPHIYHIIPAEEDLYALHIHRARLVRRDVALVIDMARRVSYSKGRRWAIKQGGKHQIKVSSSTNFGGFMKMQEDVLASKYNARPVHSTVEIETLAARFPKNIRLFLAENYGEIVAGVIIFENERVARTQYIATTVEGRKKGALDCVLDHLISETYAAKRYFDFGTSSDNNGGKLNAGLIENKQSYGGRAVVYDRYELILNDQE
jgi:hypothetical protein